MNLDACTCGGALKVRRLEHREKIGRHETVEQGVPWLVCTKCGEQSITAETWHKAELRAAFTVLHEVPRVDGAVLRAVRKILGLTQKQLGAILDFDNATISRLEASSDPIQRTTQLALSSLVTCAQNGQRLELPQAPPEGEALIVAEAS